MASGAHQVGHDVLADDGVVVEWLKPNRHATAVSIVLALWTKPLLHFGLTIKNTGI